VEQIDRQIESGACERALELLRNAAVEFPDDAELAALTEVAKQRRSRAAEAQQMFQQGQELCEKRQFSDAIEVLRRACAMDEHNEAIRTFLLETLLDQARAVIDNDWRAAEALCQQALDLDPGHALAKGVRGMALDRKREEEVSQSVAEARRMQAAGNVHGALERIEQTLGSYPREPRLVQLHATLSKALLDHTRTEATRAVAAAQLETVAMPPADHPAVSQTAFPESTTPEGWEVFERRLREQAASVAAPDAASSALTQPPSMTASAQKSPVLEPPQDTGASSLPAVELGSTALLHSSAGAAAPPPLEPPFSPELSPPPGPLAPPARAEEPIVPRPPMNRNLILAGAAAVLVLIIAWFVARSFRPVTIVIRTNPQGAIVRVNNEVKGSSQLSLKLRAGTYQVSAEKEGFQPASAALIVKRGSPSALDLVLQPVPPTIPATPMPQILRLASDLQSGKVKFDSDAPADLQDGQFANEALGLGKHTLEVTSGSVKSTISFESASGRMPVLTEAPTAQEVKAVVVTSYQNQSHIQPTYGPVKVAVENQDYGEVGPAGIDISNLTPGTHEIVLTEGKNRYTMSLTNGASPTLQVQLYSDRNVGSLIILTPGLEDVQVELDGKPYKQRRKSKNGQIRITNLAVKQHAIRVSKDGFQDEPPQTADVKKGEEAKLEFHLRPNPTTAALAIHGAAAGAQVKLDQKPVGTVEADGSLSLPNIPPGGHTIEIAGYKPVSKSFKAGDTVTVSQSDLVSQVTKLAVKVTVTPANATVTYKGADGRTHELHGPTVELDEGQYTFNAAAPAHIPDTQAVTVAAGRPNTVMLNLSPARGGTVAIGPVTMEQWALQSGWKLDNGWYVHRGGGLVLYPTQPSAGSFVFSARRQGGILGNRRIEWVVGCVDDKSNYVRFGIDKKNLHRAEVTSGKKQKEDSEPLKTPAKELEFTVKIEISAAGVITSIQQNGSWEKIDSWATSGLNPANGKFGFYLPGNDEVFISNFTFTSK
jgi:hypothetical protein